MLVVVVGEWDLLMCLTTSSNWLEPYQRHCVVSLNKTLYLLLSAGSTQETTHYD